MATAAWSNVVRRNMTCIAKYAVQKKSAANFMRQVISQRDIKRVKLRCFLRMIIKI